MRPMSCAKVSYSMFESKAPNEESYIFRIPKRHHARIHTFRLGDDILGILNDGQYGIPARQMGGDRMWRKRRQRMAVRSI